MITRKVKNLTTAIEMKEIAANNNVMVNYEYDGQRWYVVKFDCNDYAWRKLNFELKKQLQKIQL